MNMKKNIVQDVIPPKKSIRNVELLYKSKKTEKKNTQKILKDEDLEPTPPVKPVEEFTYKYEYDEPVKKSKKWLYVSLFIFLLIVGFAVSAFFKSANVKITPKTEIVNLDNKFKAQKNNSTNLLTFQIVTTTKDVEKSVPATKEEQVEKKASGTIVVYNNYSTESQKLVKTTRFETPEGLIFRAMTDVVVPGIQTKNGKSVAGSAEVVVEADKSGIKYNIGLKDFNIVGFKGTSKYSKIYARSKTEMTGGFSGLQKTVSKEATVEANAELEQQLKDSLSKDIMTQIPENFILYSNSVSYKLDDIVNTGVSSKDNSGADNVILKKKGSVSAIIFDKGSLSRTIITKLLPEVSDDVIKITNLDSLEFSIEQPTQFNLSSSDILEFNLKGSANLVWVIDENKLKSDLLGLSKKNAITIISTYKNIDEAVIETHPFWNQTIPNDANDVKLLNTTN